MNIIYTLDQIADSQPLWPDYDPVKIPLAIYGGENTYLFRHPAPPEGFEPVAGTAPEIYLYPGRYPAVNANSSAEIGGTMSATLLLGQSPDNQTALELAAVLLHEAFHVYQRENHPGWVGDEAALFLYPVADTNLLVMRRLEMKSLQRALTGSDPSGCWASLALDYRRQRFALMDPMFVSYERGTELNEGLAAYIQFKASGAKELAFPVNPFMATQIRQRAYVSGPALALLLDRFDPGWSEALEEHDEDTLDSLLGAAIGKITVVPDKVCNFTPLELAEARETASDDVMEIDIHRKKQREALDRDQGWHVIVQASESSPLWPQGFDPINVELLEDGLLHTRWLRLGNDAGQLEAIDGESVDISALTRRAGEHPLYNGVSWVMITGLDEPKIDSQNGVVSISAPGFDAHFDNATSLTVERIITLTLH